MCVCVLMPSHAFNPHPGLDVHQHLPRWRSAAPSVAAAVAGAAEAIRADEGQDAWLRIREGWKSMENPWDMNGIFVEYQIEMDHLIHNQA